MKIDFKTIIIGSLSVVIIFFVMRECAEPVEQREAEREKLFKTNIAILEAEKTSIQAVQDSIVKQVTIRARKDSVQLATQDARIKALQNKLANQRPKVIEKIQADSAVLSYVNTLEETVTELQVQNDTLKAQKEFQRKLNEQLIFNEITEDKIESQMAIETSLRISDLEKQAKKKERKSRLARVLIPIAAVAGLLIGSAL